MSYLHPSPYGSPRRVESMQRQSHLTSRSPPSNYMSTYNASYALSPRNDKRITPALTKPSPFIPHNSRFDRNPKEIPTYTSSKLVDRTPKENYSQRDNFNSLDRNFHNYTARRSASLNRSISTDHDLNSYVSRNPKQSHTDQISTRNLETEFRSNLTLSRNNHHYSSPGEIGLDNLGNTCFMNSIIQCLSHTRLLWDYINSRKYKREPSFESKNGSVMEGLETIMDDLWRENSLKSSVRPTGFKSLIEKASGHFSGYDQQDAHEFLLFLLDALHQEVNRCRGAKNSFNMDDLDKIQSEKFKAEKTWEIYLKLDDSYFVDQFVGLMKTTLRCQKCGKTSTKYEPFWDLSLPLSKDKNTLDLKECFNLFTSEEILSGDEQPLCSYCKQKTECSMRLSLHRVPNLLVIHLKRFSVGLTRSKVGKFVNFPHQLDIGKYVDNFDDNPSSKYNLYAVTNHVGTPYAGHYTAHCKNFFTNKWHTFSDDIVRGVQEASVVSSDAYILFYERLFG